VPGQSSRTTEQQNNRSERQRTNQSDLLFCCSSALLFSPLPRRPNSRATSRASGLALLEVVLALSIFFVTAVFVLDGLNSATRAVRRARLDAQAADLSVTVWSLVQLGEIEMADDGPVQFDEPAPIVSDEWTWELTVLDFDNANPEYLGLKRIQIVIRNDIEDYTHRTTHLVFVDPYAPEEEEAGAGAAAPGGGL
jgi:hypothetical protein